MKALRATNEAAFSRLPAGRRRLVIQWALDRPGAALEDMGVDHGGLDVLMAEQFPWPSPPGQAVEHLRMHARQPRPVRDQLLQFPHVFRRYPHCRNQVGCQQACHMKVSFLSVFTRAHASCLTLIGVAASTFATNDSNRSFTCQTLVVDSITTWSLGSKCFSSQSSRYTCSTRQAGRISCPSRSTTATTD
jgi:hypothetical protein